MFVEVLSLTYHSPITIDSLTYAYHLVLFGTCNCGFRSVLSLDGHLERALFVDLLGLRPRGGHAPSPEDAHVVNACTG